MAMRDAEYRLRAVPHFDIPLDLPHAGRVASRIVRLLERHCDENSLEAEELLDVAEKLDVLLSKYVQEGDNPYPGEAQEARQEAAELGRRLVTALETAGIRGDRLGQYVRNLFECLAMGKEGAEISLRAGEDPGSLQRPV
jgi:hypothetical protein